MPFKSEKQRRYLWANEPEIARDWTDTYGSRIHKAGGQLVKPGPGRPGYYGADEGHWSDPQAHSPNREHWDKPSNYNEGNNTQISD